MFRHKFVGHLTSQLSGSQVDLAYKLLHSIIFHRDRIGIEGVRCKDICSGIQILTVNGFDNIRTGNTQQVVVSFQLSGEVGKTVAAVILFIQFEALDHGTHTTIQNQDTLLQGPYKSFFIHRYVFFLVKRKTASQYILPFKCSVHLPLIVTGLDRIALIVFFLTFGDGDNYFG